MNLVMAARRERHTVSLRQHSAPFPHGCSRSGRFALLVSAETRQNLPLILPERAGSLGHGVLGPRLPRVACGEGEGAYAHTRPCTARSTADATLSTNQIAGDNRTFAASTVSTHAQTTNWAGAVSSDWFDARNWNFRIPSGPALTSANINTVTPNATEITRPGATALNLAVGQNGTGMLTIQSGGTLTNSLGRSAIYGGGRAR